MTEVGCSESCYCAEISEGQAWVPGHPLGTLSPPARFSSDLWGTGPKPSIRQGRAIKGGTGVATAPCGCVMEVAIKPVTVPYLLSRLPSLETQGLGDSRGLSTFCQALWDPPTGQALEIFSAIKDRPWTSYRPEVGRLAHRLNPAQRRALFGPQCLI